MARASGKHILIRPGLREGETARANRQWRVLFLDHLAESSNVTESAAKAGISPSRAYKVRREEPEFARQWLAALREGYTHLEMEVVRRLREGDFRTAADEKYDFGSAIRLLAAHRDSAVRGQSQVRDVTAAEVRASIDRKIEDIRRRVAKAQANETPGS